MSGAGPFVARRPLGWDLTPAEVLRLVSNDAHPVALFGAWAGGADVVAAEPVAVVRGTAARWTTSSTATSVTRARPAGPRLRRRLDRLPRLQRGRRGAAPTGPRALPAWWFGYYDHVLCRDRATGEWHFEALWTRRARGRARAALRRAELPRGPSRPARAAASGAPATQFGPFRLIPGADQHQEAVAQGGRVHPPGRHLPGQHHLRAEAEFAGDPLDAFCQGVTALDPPYAAFIGVSAPGAGRAAVAVAVARAVPAPGRGHGHLQADQGHRAARRRRGRGRGAARRARGLGEEPRRERDDRRPGPQRPQPGLRPRLGDRPRPARPRAAPGRLAPGLHGHRHAAPRRGRRRPDPRRVPARLGDRRAEGPRAGDHRRARDAPRARPTPARSATAPRSRASSSTSPSARSSSPAGRAWIGAGGGIVADSDPAAEYAECLIKATPLLTALGARLDLSPARDRPRTARPRLGRAAAAPLGRRLHLAPGHRRPDPRPGRSPGPAGVQRPRPLRQGTARGLDADLAACLAAGPIGQAADHRPPGRRPAPGHGRGRPCRGPPAGHGRHGASRSAR